MNTRMKEALRWWEFSREDFAVAERVAVDFPRSGVWGYQQAAEKALKSWLVARGIDFPKTHDLVALFGKVQEEIGNREELLEKAAVLNAYGPSRRYPDDSVVVTQEDVTEA